MNFSSYYTLTRFLFAVLLIAGYGGKLSAQQMQIEIYLTEVGTSYDQNDYQGLDMTWVTQASVFGLTDDLLGDEVCVHMPNDSRVGLQNLRDIEDETVFDETITLTDGFDLCNTPLTLSLRVGAWEEDNTNEDNKCTADESGTIRDDAVAQTTLEMNLTLPNPADDLLDFTENDFRTTTLILKDNQSDYRHAFRFSYRYILLANPITGISFTDSNGDPIADACAGTTIRITAEQNGPVTGGTFRWQQSLAGENNWQDFRETTENYVDISAEANRQYRVSIVEDRDGTDGNGCLGYNRNNPQWVTSSEPPPVGPTVPFSDINVRTTVSCGGGNNGSLTFTPLTAIPDGLNNITLLLDGEFVTIAVDEEYTFEGLEPGEYELGVQLNGVEAAAFCQVNVKATVGKIAQPAITSLQVNDPECGETLGGMVFNREDLYAQGVGVSDPRAIIIERPGGAVLRNIALNGYSGDVPVPDLSSGDYTLRLTNGESSTEQNFTVSSPPSLPSLTFAFLNGDGDDLNCNGGFAQLRFTATGVPENLTGQLNLSGGTLGSTSYLMVDNQVDVALPAGDYVASFSISSLQGCTATAEAISIVEPASSFSGSVIASTSPSACDQNSGTADVTVTNGQSPFAFVLNGADTGQSFPTSSFQLTGLSPGTNQVELIDANGCTVSLPVNLDAQPGLNLIVNNSQAPACAGGTDGLISATATGSGVVTLALFRGNTEVATAGSTHTFTGLSAGNYRLIATDVAGCQNVRDLNLPAVGQPIVSSTTFFPVRCAGEPGLLNISISGKRYCRTDSGDRTFNNAPDFEYTTDGGSSWTPVSGFIVGFDSSRCNDQVQLQIALPVGDYGFELREALGCEILGGNRTISSAEFMVPPNFNAEVVAASDITCSGNNDGTITINFSGGRPEYGAALYRYTGGGEEFVTLSPNLEQAGNFTFTNLPPSVNTAGGGTPNGGYFLFLYDKAFPEGFEGDGCFLDLMDPINIQEPSTLIANGYDQLIPANCDGSGGQLEITGLSGGTPPYQYSADRINFGDSPILTVDNLSFVYFRDQSGCLDSLQAEFTLKPNDVAATAEVISPASCQRAATLRFTVTGGTSPYLLSYDNGSETLTVEDADGVFEAQGIEAGSYALRVEDAAGCSLVTGPESYTVLAYEPVSIALSSVTQASCFEATDGALNFNINGGAPPYTFFYQGVQSTGMQFSLADLAPGEYRFGVLDALGCQYIGSGTVGVENNLVVTDASTNDPAACADDPSGTASVTVSGGASPYQVLLLANNEQRTIPNPNGVAIFENLTVGEYRYRVTDNAGCSLEQDLSVTGPDSIVLLLGAVTQPSCSGGSNGLGTISVTASGGAGTLSYQLNNNAPTSDPDFTGLAGGDYTIIAIDENGCSSPALTINLVNTGAVEASGAGTQVQCFGQNSGGLTITPQTGQPPFTYELIGGSGPQSEPTFDGLAAGTYSVSVVDDNGCSTTVTNILVEEPAQLVAGGTSDGTCVGSSDGQITATPSGGTGPYFFSLDGASPVSSGTFMGLVGRQYLLTITDDRGCTLDTTITVENLPAIVTELLSQTNANCTTPGTATISASGGTGALTILWSSGETDPTATMLAAGDNTVTVTDANGCTDVLTVSIAQSESPSLRLETQTAAGCTTPGTATVSATGGSGTLAYDWSNGETAATATTLAAGDNTVTVTDANGCTDVLTVSITQSEDPSLRLETQTAAGCTTPGTATVSATGGSGTLAYDWSNGETAATATMLAAGDNTVTVTDANGCTDVLTVSITQSEGPSLRLETQTAAGCTTPGTATVSATGGSGTLAYDWSNGETAATATMLAAGDNTVTVTDANGCTDVLTVSITQSEGPSLRLETQTAAGCTTPGTATVSATGGSGMLAYDWSNGETAATATMLAAGDNTVTVTDANGCTDVLTVSITQSEDPSLRLETQTAAGCTTPGTATVSATGGSGTLAYDWSNGETAATATMLAAGDNTVTVTDANGCTDVLTVSIAQSEGPSLRLETQTAAGCTTPGTATVSATGGSGALAYDWSNGETAATATMLAAGDNTVTVTDAAGCTDVLTVSITQSEGPSLRLETQTAAGCTTPGTATVSATGGSGTLAYDWSNGETAATATMLAAGDNTVTVTDANGCTDVLTVSIAQSEGPSLRLETQTAAGCTTPGTATVSATGGSGTLAYDWSNGETAATATMLAAGDNTVTVTDANGCTDVLTVSIAQSEGPSLRLETQTAAGCTTPGRAIVSATGGSGTLAYDWSNGETAATATMLAAGDNTVTVTDANGCTDVLTVSITQSEDPSLRLETQTAAGCTTPGTATVSATGGSGTLAYDWSNGETAATATMLAAGDNTVTVTDANGCTDVLTVSIAQSEGPSLRLETQTAAGCTTPGTATVSATGGSGALAYDWSNGETAATATMLAAGDNTVTVTDAAGCTDVLTVSITQSEGPSLRLETQTAAGCTTPGTATVSATGGSGTLAYDWSNGETAATATMLAAGDNTVTVTDANGCTDVLTVSIAQSEGPSLRLETQTAAGCTTPGTATVSATGGSGTLAYDWSNGETAATATMLAAGDNTVTVTDANGCTDVLTVSIAQSEGPSLRLETQTAAGCTTPGRAIVSATGGSGTLAYDWSNGETAATATMLAAGDNTVTVTDANGCTDVLTVLTEQTEDISITDEVIEAATCGLADGSIIITAIGGTGQLNYNWSVSGAPDEPAITGLLAGDYGLTVTDEVGCTQAVTVTIPGGRDIDISGILPNDTTICDNASLNLDLTDYAGIELSGPGGYFSTEPQLNLVDPGSYLLRVTTTEGCEAEKSFNLSLSSDFFVAEFVAPTDAIVDLPVVVLETSFPAPSSFAFSFDDSRVSQTDQVGNQYRFLFPEPGNYNITLSAQFGSCADRLEKAITIHADSSSIPGAVLGGLEILTLTVGPNPAIDQFVVTSTLARPQPVSLTLYDGNGNPVEQRDLLAGSTAVEETFSVNTLVAGSYYLQIRAGGDRRVATIIVGGS